MKQPAASEFSNGGDDGTTVIGWDDGYRLPGELGALTRHAPETLY